MFETQEYGPDRQANYETLKAQLSSLMEGEADLIANLANASALLAQFLENINWVGFYLWKDDSLVLGPFQGLPACVRIASGKGVCGTAFASGRVQRVDDVRLFPGHIVCDARSVSEIVIPLRDSESILFGVLDIDSPVPARFDAVDAANLEEFASILSRSQEPVSPRS